MKIIFRVGQAPLGDDDWIEVEFIYDPATKTVTAKALEENNPAHDEATKNLVPTSGPKEVTKNPIQFEEFGMSKKNVDEEPVNYGPVII